MGEPCDADELRSLFLFEHLSDDQLELLCAEGRIETFPAGMLFSEGEPATTFYVMIEGELVMSGRAGRVDTQVHRTTQPGVYCGAWSAYVPEQAQVYEASIRLIRPTRFFVLDADKFARFMQSQFPIVVHLLAGHTLGGLRQQQLVGQRARLMALGTITAGLTHHLNNPAAATARAISDLRDSVDVVRTTSMAGFSAAELTAIAAVQQDVAHHVRSSRTPAAETDLSPRMSALDTSAREEELGTWCDDHSVTGGWDFAPTFVDAGLDVGWLNRLAAEFGGTALPAAVALLAHTADTELRIREIAEASKTISALLAGADQYSQMDRGDYQRVDVHDLLRSTLLMFEAQLRTDNRIEVVTDWDHTLPDICCYAGDLNQVWTNIITNAIEAMDGAGTLTVRTARENDTMVRVEIGDDGRGIADEDIDHIFTPFFTTKPVGEGTGLGLDLVWRIVEKHRGRLSVESRPGDTRFVVCLPWEAPTS